MKFARLILAILFILILGLFFFDFPRTGPAIRKEEGGFQGHANRNPAKSQSKKNRGVTPSERKLVTAARLDAHSISLDDGESVFLKGRQLSENVSEIIYLSAELVVQEDGNEVVRLLRKVIHTWNGDAQVGGEADFFQEDENEWIVDERARQIQFRKLSQTKGTNIMTMETKLLGLGDTFDAVVAQGEEALCIDGVAERGRDGELRLKLGHLYARPGGE